MRQWFSGLKLAHLRVCMVALVITAAQSTASAADGTIESIQKITADANAALLSEQFALLNTLTDGMATSRERLPDGRWKLPFAFYGLVAGVTDRDESAWSERLALMDKWIAKSPTHAAPYLAKAYTLIQYAWDGRGSGYASSVSDSEWAVFKQRMEQARHVLDASSKISKRSPMWYDLMMGIALAQGWPEKQYFNLFREAVAKEPTYYTFYFSAASYFSPKWHGSASEVAQFVAFAVESTKQQEGQTLYARIYWALLGDLQNRTFSPGYADWPRMRQGFQDIVKSYPDNWNLNAFVYYACMAHDFDTAQQVSPRLGSVDMKLWRSPAVYKACMDQTRKAGI